jgi:hypothetical protein
LFVSGQTTSLLASDTEKELVKDVRGGMVCMCRCWTAAWAEERQERYETQYQPVTRSARDMISRDGYIAQYIRGICMLCTHERINKYINIYINSDRKATPKAGGRKEKRKRELGRPGGRRRGMLPPLSGCFRHELSCLAYKSPRR